MNEFAKRAAPPTDYFRAGMIASITCGGMLALMVALGLLVWDGFLLMAFITSLFAVPTFLVGVVMMVFTRHKRQHYARQQADWERSWICSACGAIFIP